MTSSQAIWLVALREIRERGRGRAYLLSTLLLIAMLGLAIALPKLISTGTTTYRYGVVGTPPLGLRSALRSAAEPHEADVTVRVYPSRSRANTALEDGQVDALLSPVQHEIRFHRDVDEQMVAVARQALTALALPQRLRHLGLSPATFALLVAAPTLHAKSTHPGAGVSDRTARLVAMGGASLMLIAISLYGSWVMAGVAQEKSNRIAELLVAAIRPYQLLAGKVLGIGALGLAQVLIVASVVAVTTAVGLTDLPSSFVPAAALVVPWFILGFALYAVAFGVAGAVVIRQEDVATVATPVTVVMTASFLLAYASLQSTPDGIASQIATVFPTTAPFMVPARSATSGVPMWQHLTALALAVATLYGLVRLGGRLYAAALLHSGSSTNFGALWRLARR
jgi:ABC-2 type transport system permease protein